VITRGLKSRKDFFSNGQLKMNVADKPATPAIEETSSVPKEPVHTGEQRCVLEWVVTHVLHHFKESCTFWLESTEHKPLLPHWF
jgi:hypothetical protein